MGWLEREVILNNEKGKPAGGIRADLKKKIHNSSIRFDEGLNSLRFLYAINLVDITKLPWDKNP